MGCICIVTFWVLAYICLNHYKELIENSILVPCFQGIVIHVYVIISVKVEVDYYVVKDVWKNDICYIDAGYGKLKSLFAAYLRVMQGVKNKIL